MSEDQSSAGNCVRPHLRVLRAVGFCRLAAGGGDGSGSLRCRLHAAYHTFALLVTSTFVLQQLIYAYQERRDMEKLSRVLFVLLCHVTCVAKQLVFHGRAAGVDALVAGLDEPLLNESGTGAGAARRRAAAARGAARLLRGYVACAVATCVLWGALAVAERARAPARLPFWVPFRYDAPPAFAAVLAYSLYATNLVAVGNPTMDAFVAAVLHQCKTQLAILRNEFEELPRRARSAAARSGRNFETVLYRSFVDRLVHYEKIIKTCGAVQDAFGAALLVQFAAGGWILCLAAYKIVSVAVLSIEFASTSLFIACILTELLLYCYCGNELAVESDRVVESLYCMEWVSLGPRFRRALLVVMTRAQRPLRPAAGAVIPLTLHTYLTILKSSYSFYAVLRQTK